MQGTSLRSETKLVNAPKNGSSTHSNFTQLRLNDCSTAPNRDEQHFWPRVPSMEFSQSKELAMHQLVQRVKQRRNGEQNAVMGKPPMIIKAYRPPRIPYVIQQQSLKKRVMVVRPDLDNDKKKGRKSHLFPSPKKIGPSSEGHVTTKLATTRTDELEMNTWRPALKGQHQPYVLPSAEDRYVQNYKLQMQQAAKLIDGRYHHAACFVQGGYALNHGNPLPPIAMSQPGAREGSMDVDEHETQLPAAASGIQENSIHLDFTDCNAKKISKKLQKEKWKVVEGEAYENNLRTKHKFTNAKRQFKDDLERIRELSAIREDLSVFGDRAQRQSLSSIRGSTPLNRIEEINAINNSNNVEGSLYNAPPEEKETLNVVGHSAQVSSMENKVIEATVLPNNKKELPEDDESKTIRESGLSRQKVDSIEIKILPSIGIHHHELAAIKSFNETDNHTTEKETRMNDNDNEIQPAGQQYIDDVRSKSEEKRKTNIKRTDENLTEDGYYRFVSNDHIDIEEKTDEHIRE